MCGRAERIGSNSDHVAAIVHTHTQLNVGLGFMSEKVPDVLSKGRGRAILLRGCLRLLVPFDPSALCSVVLKFYQPMTNADCLPLCAALLPCQRG